MVFLSLRNNRKLSHSWVENIRKSFFGAIIATSILLMIIGLDIHHDQFNKDVLLPFDIHYMTTFITTFASIPLTMFIILTMNKHEYGRWIYRYFFETIYMTICISLATVFYLHVISVEMVQIAFLVASVLVIFVAFILSRLHINYKASTMYGPLVIKPISYDSKLRYVLLVMFMAFGFMLNAGNILYFHFVDTTTDNYLVYQFLIQVASIVFLLLCIGIFSSSRSIGQSQEVLYYRYAQLLVLSLIFLVVGIGIYRIYAPVNNPPRALIDNISIGLDLLPIIILFIDLYYNARKIKKDRNYQGFTEYRLLIKIFAAVMAILVIMTITGEIKYFQTGEETANIDVTIIGLVAILIIIAVPFFIFWKKMTKRSSRILITILFLVLGFVLYKFFFYADFNNDGARIFGIPVDSIYTMVTLLSVLGVEVLTIILQAKNSGIAFDRYGHKNTVKGASNE